MGSAVGLQLSGDGSELYVTIGAKFPLDQVESGVSAARMVADVAGLKYPTLTPDEVAVALCERELEQAKSCGVSWSLVRYGPRWNYVVKSAAGYDNHDRDTRLAAAQAACARVAELRAEEERKRLPDVEEMSDDEIVREIAKRGGSIKGGISSPAVFDKDDETTEWRGDTAHGRKLGLAELRKRDGDT